MKVKARSIAERKKITNRNEFGFHTNVYIIESTNINIAENQDIINRF